MKFNSRSLLFSILGLIVTSSLLLSSAENLLLILMYVLAAYVAVESVRPMYYIVRMIQAGTVKNAWSCVVPGIALALCVFVFFYPMWPESLKHPVEQVNTLPFVLVGVAALIDVLVGVFTYFKLRQTNKILEKAEIEQNTVETIEPVETVEVEENNTNTEE